MPMPIVPKKEKPDPLLVGEGRVRSIWTPDALWAEIQLAAKREGYSTSKFVSFLLRGGLAGYEKERLEERKAEAKPEKP